MGDDDDRDDEDLVLEADDRIATESPRRLLDLYLALEDDKEVGFRGAERRPWDNADRAVRSDLEQLVAAIDKTPAQHDRDELSDMVSALKRRAPDLDSAAVLGTLLDVLRARTRDVPTRFVGASAKGIDWGHAAEVLAAWHASLRYSDGDGDETYLPSVAEPLVELWTRQQQRTTSARPVKASGPLRPYDPRARYAVGDAIAHGRFGDGVVVSISDAHVVIRFASGEKKLMHGPATHAAAASTSTSTPSTAAPRPAVKRLPPDPRLLETDRPDQFADLGSGDREPEE